MRSSLQAYFPFPAILRDLLEIEVGFAFPEEERSEGFELLLRQGAWGVVARSRNPDVVDERQHPELLETRV